MSGFGKVMKDGWHPKGKDGNSKESWRGDFKGINQVAGWMGKGKDKSSSEKDEHVSAPLSSLKDPSAFGPPPRHIRYHGPGAVPNQTTPDTRGLGAPLSQDQLHHQYLVEQQQQAELEAQEEQARKPAPPPLPYRANRTGVDPNTLPPPPVRRVTSPAESSVSSNSSRPHPSVPPRAPPRTSTVPSPPPAYSPHEEVQQPLQGELNHHSTSNLSRAGVSVPALGIGNGRTASPTTAGYGGQPRVDQLQSRFSQMRTNSSSPSHAPSPPVRGNTYDQSSPVAASSPHSASSTINEFRERHADKIDAGKQKISGFGQRIGTFIDDRRSAPSTHSPVTTPPIRRPTHPSPTNSNADMETQARKKAPPPPPPKKSGMRSTPVNPPSPAPPPVPLNTKPR
ncbi:hypothetical protein FE257_010269 [Aspergillus nanangensis]|uniref:Uncharacterized protein n=1 Tax=Aspergillus nanangensis TaxID=2582783 RepID=A0AAD4GRG8_ASPNN|nr:hypothetical protein FE257_010269 [Aspergillus nanangensis]